MRRSLTLPGGKVAALFIDLQEEHRGDQRFLVEGYTAVLTNVERLQHAARRNAVPLNHCAYVVDLESASLRPFHPIGADGKSVFSDKSDPMTVICPEVGPCDNENFFIKTEASAFGVKPLATNLKAQGIEWLVVAGVWTEACVDATVKDAGALGFRVLLVKDACGSGTSAMHEIAILNIANRLYGGAVVSTEAACRLLDGDTVDAWQIEGAVPMRYTLADATILYKSL